MKLFDSHCHLDDRAFQSDLDEVIKRSAAAGVAALMIVGIHQKSSQRAIQLAQSHEGFYASVGVHPHDTERCDETTLESLRRLAHQPKVRAWGEIGLDFNRMFSPQPVQEKWFIRQLELALELNLPVIFHERDSNGRLLDIIRQWTPGKITGVIHCFSGNQRELNQYLNLGLYIGITGVVTIKERGARLRELIPCIPTNQLLIETDAPYLTPAPEKNTTRRNEPAFVKSVLLNIAAIRNVPPQELAARVWDNTCRLFHV